MGLQTTGVRNCTAFALEQRLARAQVPDKFHVNAYAVACYDGATTPLNHHATTMSVPHPDRALLLFAHGSSDPGWAAPFRRLQAAVQAREPGRMVELAFLERMEPSFDECVNILHQRGVREVMVAPIFLALGGHMRKDLPALVTAARERTGMRFRVLPALGEIDALIDAIADWAAGAAHD